MCKEKKRRKQCGRGEAKQNCMATGRMIFQWFSPGPLRWVVWLLNKKQILQWENNPILMYHLATREQYANDSSPRGGTSQANI